jgi:uncharacterized membrane protein
VADEDESSKRKGYGLERTLALSDGVFAFAVTLLVLDLAVPALASGASSSDLLAGLSKDYIGFLNFILSFFIAGVWWNAHHRNFEHIRGQNTALRFLNLFFLMWIALLPFFTKILSQYNTLQASIVLYAADQAAAGAFLTILWLYASKNHRLIDKTMPARAVRFATIRNVIVPLFFLFSIALSFISTALAGFSWYGLLPIFVLVVRWEQKSERQGKKTEVAAKTEKALQTLAAPKKRAKEK